MYWYIMIWDFEIVKSLMLCYTSNDNNKKHFSLSEVKHWLKSLSL